MEGQEYQINTFLTVRMQNGQTLICVTNEPFSLCKSLIFNIPMDNIKSFDKIESIDDVAEKLGWTEEGQIIENSHEYEISPETEFWGHCSNLQVWVENNYDTRLLHSNLAFPLLKKLVQVGDEKAKKVFKEEIIKRLKSQNTNVIKYLILEDYLKEFDIEERKLLIEDKSINLLELILQCEFDCEILIQILQKLENDTQITFGNKIKTIFEEKKYLCIEELLFCNCLAYMNGKSIISILNSHEINYFQILRDILKQKPDLIHDINDNLMFFENDKKIVKA